MIHRGPDDGGVYVNGSAALGMRRLSIIDIEGGAQPMFNEDRAICAVLNGEIYNFQALRRDLISRGHRLSTRSDTEVVVHLYEDYGPSFIERLNGMFAIAIWDDRRQRLFLARDRLGVKPLYYTTVSAAVVFGSEIKCLLEHPAVSRELDCEALCQYFALGYIPQPRSIYAGIKKLPPGCYLLAEEGRIDSHRYWELPSEVDGGMDRREAGENLRKLLEDAVRLRMISDVPLGAFLSGGLDSSITVALMAKTSPQQVKTFFIDFDESGYSERDYARAVAEKYNTDHHELVVRPSAIDVLDDLVYHFDEPFGDSSAIPTYYVAKLTREHVTVALAGDGGDESFGGYNRYRHILARRDLSLFRRGVGPLANAFERLLPRTAPGRQWVRSLGMSNRQHYVAGTQEHDARSLLSPDVLASVEGDIVEQLENAYPGAWGSDDPLLPYSHFDLQWYLPDDILTKVDRMSMAHSLEVRGPFLDYRVVELAAQMPFHWKIHGHDSKVILKEIFRNDLPPTVLEPRKRGFSIPLADWLRTGLRPALLDVIHDPEVADSGIFNMREVQGLAHEHLSGARNRKSQLWRIMFFARWWQTNRGAVVESANGQLAPPPSDLHVGTG